MKNVRLKSRKKENMKKIIISFSILLILFIPTIASAITVSVSNASGHLGDTAISVPITVSNVGTREIIDFDIRMTYNKDLIEAVKVLKGAQTSGWSLTANTALSGEIRIALFNTSPLASSGGEIVKIEFNVKPTALGGTTSLLHLTRANSTETPADVIRDGTFTIVALPNRPPVLESIGDKEVNEAQTLIFNIIATDPDGDTLTYSASNVPINASFNPNTRLFSFSPNSTQAGSYSVTFTVSDGSLSDSEAITITVNNVIRTYSLTINATNGSVTRNPNQTSYNEGTHVTLTATPNTGYSFTGWSGDASGSANPATIIMDKDKTITVNFERIPDVGVSILNSQGYAKQQVSVPISVTDVTGLGFISCQINLKYDLSLLTAISVNNTNTITQDWGAPVYNLKTGEVSISLYGTTPLAGSGTLVNIVFEVNANAQAATTNLDLTQAKFNDGGVPSILMDGVFTVLQIPNQPPVLNPIGNKSVDEASSLIIELQATDPDGDTLTHSAANLPTGATFSAANKTFSWTPDYTQSGSYKVTFSVSDGKGGSDSEEITITVNNVVRTYTLTISATTGTVSKNPNQTSYNEGTNVTLTATANTGYSFSSWSGDLTGSTNPATITMNTNKTVTANFSITTYTLTINATNGSVTKSPNQTSYNYGTNVTLTATANAGYLFNGWSGDLSGKDNPAIITMDKNKSITANFALIPALSVTVAAAQGQPAEKDIVVPISVSDITGLGFISCQMDLKYDANLLSATGVNVNGAITSGWGSPTYNLKTGEVIISLYGTTALSGAGKLVNLIFEVKPSASAQDTLLDLTQAKFNDGTISSTLVDDVFKINPLPNRNPVLADIGNKSIDEGKLLEIQISATDADGDSLTYSDTGLPEGAGFSQGAGRFSWTPTATQAGTYTVHFEVRDGRGGVDSEDVIIVVRDSTPTTYTISASAGEGGSIEPSGEIIVEHGENKTLTIQANPGYYISGIIIDGSLVEVTQGCFPTTRSYTFENVTGNHRIEATFASVLTYTISTIVSGEGGMIEPSGNISVPAGDNKTFHIAVALGGGAYIVDVKVDGESKGPITSYTFENVRANHTIEAIFAIRRYTITAKAGTGGNIEPNGSVLVYGDICLMFKFTITSNPGYRIKDVKVDGNSVGAVANYTFTLVTADHTIEATFERNIYTISATAGEGGTIEPSGDVVVNHEEDQAFTITANSGYQIDDVLVDGNSVGAKATHTFTNVTGDHRIVAEFKAVEEPTPPTPPEPPTPPASPSLYPWSFDPKEYNAIPYYYPIYGTAVINGKHLSIGDWVGAFDEDGNCYGVGQYQFDGTRARYYYALSTYPKLVEDGIDGFNEAEELFFKFYVAGTKEEIDAVPSPFAVYTYPNVIGGNVDPVEINLVNVDTLTVPLKEGWNFISFNIQPLDSKVEEVLSSVSEKVEYITDHKSWWEKSITGSLTEVTPYNSYYVKANADCTLTIKGSRIQLPYILSLSKGWNSISYPYEKSGVAIGRTKESSIYTGFFKEIIKNIVWIKGKDGWCTSEIGEITLEPPTGVFIKVKEPCNLTLPMKQQNTQ